MDYRKKAKLIIRKAKRKNITTNAIEVYKSEIEYARENKNDIDYDNLINLASKRLVESDDIIKLFDKRIKINKQRVASIKETMYSSGEFDNIDDITNQDIIDYIENIEKLTDNIAVLSNLASEQVGDIYLMAKNKNMTTSELITIINTAKQSVNTYSRFIETIERLIEEF